VDKHVHRDEHVPAVPLIGLDEGHRGQGDGAVRLNGPRIGHQAGQFRQLHREQSIRLDVTVAGIGIIRGPVEEGLVAQLVVGQRVFPTHRLPDLVRDQIGYVRLHLAALEEKQK